MRMMIMMIILRYYYGNIYFAPLLLEWWRWRWWWQCWWWGWWWWCSEEAPSFPTVKCHNRRADMMPLNPTYMMIMMMMMMIAMSLFLNLLFLLQFGRQAKASKQLTSHHNNTKQYSQFRLIKKWAQSWGSQLKCVWLAHSIELSSFTSCHLPVCHYHMSIVIIIIRPIIACCHCYCYITLYLYCYAWPWLGYILSLHFFSSKLKKSQSDELTWVWAFCHPEIMRMQSQNQNRSQPIFTIFVRQLSSFYNTCAHVKMEVEEVDVLSCLAWFSFIIKANELRIYLDRI